MWTTVKVGRAEILIDIADLHFLDGVYLSIHRRRGRRSEYCMADTYKDGTTTKGLLHRHILQAPRDKQVDHINGNGLDNRRHNLRLCTQSENLRNRFSSPGQSGYHGVASYKNRFKWKVTLNGKIHRGYSFLTARAAAVARDKFLDSIGDKFTCRNVL